MKTKRIWIWAFIFGLIATASFYYLILSAQKDTKQAEQQQVEEEAPPEAEPEEEEVMEEEEEVHRREITIEKGKRAMSLQVGVAEGVSGFITPDSRVDLVYVQRPPEEAKDQHEAATLLMQNIKVLTVGHAADSEGEAVRYQTVTLELTTYEALALGFAKKGEIYLLLRNPDDEEIEPERTHIHEDELHWGVFRRR